MDSEDSHPELKKKLGEVKAQFLKSEELGQALALLCDPGRVTRLSWPLCPCL